MTRINGPNGAPWMPGLPASEDARDAKHTGPAPDIQPRRGKNSATGANPRRNAAVPPPGMQPRRGQPLQPKPQSPLPGPMPGAWPKASSQQPVLPGPMPGAWPGSAVAEPSHAASTPRQDSGFAEMPMTPPRQAQPSPEGFSIATAGGYPPPNMAQMPPMPPRPARQPAGFGIPHAGGYPPPNMAQMPARQPNPLPGGFAIPNPGGYPPLNMAHMPSMQHGRGQGPARHQGPQLSPDVGRLYQQLNLQVTPETKPAFTDAALAATPKKLGAGAFNTVFSVKVRNPDRSQLDRPQLDGVFKPLSNEEGGGVALATGIPRHNPQIAIRNLATLDYSKALGFDVVADTKVALITPPGERQPKLGLMMERAQGQTPWDTPPDILNRPEVTRETTKLQLLDHLTGQGDRTTYNYFVKVDPTGKVKITGIDNDQCFGQNLTRPEDIRFTGEAGVMRGTGLPPVVDREMFNAINNLSTADVRKMLGGKLSDAEVNSALLRLQGVKQHIQKLDHQGLVIAPNQWGSVMHLLSADNSYAKRDLGYAVGRQQNGGF
jgi:hypothetical protein